MFFPTLRTISSLMTIQRHLCRTSRVSAFSGNVPSGGDSPQYKYVWQKRSNGSQIWIAAAPKSYEHGYANRITGKRHMDPAYRIIQGLAMFAAVYQIRFLSLHFRQSQETPFLPIRRCVKASCLPIWPAVHPPVVAKAPGSYSWQWQKKIGRRIQFYQCRTGWYQKNSHFGQSLSDTTVYQKNRAFRTRYILYLQGYQ